MIYNLWAFSMLPRLGVVRRLRGTYSTWKEASERCVGYADPTILETCTQAARRVRDGQAAWERDSVPMPRVEYSWPVLAELLRVHAERKRLSVLDFGGGFGSSYRQLKHFAPSLPDLRWTVVEQDSVVERGQAEFSTDELKFRHTVAQAQEQEPNVVLLSSVLQYLPDPESTATSLKALELTAIIIDRTPISDRSFFSVQHVPGSIYAAAYPIRIFSSMDMDQLFQGWWLQAEFPSYCDFPKKLFRGRIYRKVGHVTTQE